MTNNFERRGEMSSEELLRLEELARKRPRDLNDAMCSKWFRFRYTLRQNGTLNPSIIE